MKDLFFWKVWSPSERRMAVLTLAVIFFAIVFFITKILDPLGNVIRWNVLSELSEVNAVTDVLQLGQWQYGISVPSHLVTESFAASVMETDLLTVQLFWVFVLIGICIILAALTTMPRFWYLAGMALFILALAFSRLETLNVFGDGNRSLFLLAVILYVGLTYYFHAFRPDLGIAVRVLGLIGVSAFLIIIVHFTSKTPFPAVTAAAYAFPFLMLLTVLFLLMISTEIMAGLVWLSSSGTVTNGKPGLIRFILISVLYLFLLLLMYLKNTMRIDWNMTLISPVFLALASAVLGLWGFRKRADSTGIIPFRGTGFWLYAGLFMIAAAFTAYAAGTANDPVLESLEDVVVQGQLAMSVLFLFYVLVNFYQLFMQGLAVHKVLYKPLRFGLTQTRLFGFAGVVVLFSIQKLLPVNQAIAGYFNGLGDLHASSNEFPLAEQYYKLALQQEFQNHKSNYALASLALRQGDHNAAAYYFRQSLLKNPSPQAYAGLSGILAQENLFFDAVYSLQEGIGKFPKSGELLNNLGMLYSRTNVADSAYYYLQKAEGNTKRNEIPATNLLAIMAKSTDSALLDSLAANTDKQTYLSWRANWLAVQNLRRKFSKEAFLAESVPKDSLLSVSGLAYLLNYARNQARQDSMPAILLPKLAAKNPVLSQDLLFASLYPQFYSGNKLIALETLSAWAGEEDEKSDLYHKVLGHWLLQLGLYDKAIEALSLVEGTEGTLGMAVANALSDKKEVSVILLDKIQEKEKSPAIEQLKKTLFSGVRPVSGIDSLLQVAQKSPSDKNFKLAVNANPFDPHVVAAAATYYRQAKQTTKAYRLVVDALRFNEYAPQIWEHYAYLSLDQGLMSQGDEGAEKVRQLASAADYQLFLNRYQPMRALIEKQRAEFQ